MKIGEKEVEIKELKYKDLVALADLPKEEAAKKIMLASTNLTEEEYENLSIKEGMDIQQEINKLNDLEKDFQ